MAASTWFLCVTFQVFAKFEQKIINFSQKPGKVTQNLPQKVMQGSSECFHVSTAEPGSPVVLLRSLQELGSRHPLTVVIKPVH